MSDTLTHRCKSVRHDTSSAALVRSLRATSQRAHASTWASSDLTQEGKTTLTNQRPVAVISRRGVFPPPLWRYSSVVASLVLSSENSHLLSCRCGQGGGRREIKDAASLQLGPTKVKRKRRVDSRAWRSGAGSLRGASETMRPDDEARLNGDRAGARGPRPDEFALRVLSEYEAGNRVTLEFIVPVSKTAASHRCP